MASKYGVMIAKVTGIQDRGALFEHAADGEKLENMTAETI